ncbi:uncharacterized protein LOC6584279 [Drosophila mojavensis]|uniref:Uncharacterized protein n=1 Tax=Drosophila mojavensis TaxID=7230 RepID=B4L3X4_DROMO|nr:uncharacterized protein LOC6584279 [Drosophila mojavensis]EDW07252.2 uncharacterized protein Dmoj_GI15641 [Drosophila mojavensis]
MEMNIIDSMNPNPNQAETLNQVENLNQAETLSLAAAPKEAPNPNPEPAPIPTPHGDSGPNAAPNPSELPESTGATASVGTQTEEVKLSSLETVPVPRKIARPRSVFQKPQHNLDIASEVCVESDRCDKRNKACQTIKTGVKRSADDSQMDNLRAVMHQRRKLAIDKDRQHLANLMEIINADPPPPWHDASLMWLEVDKLENRIEEFDKSQESG